MLRILGTAASPEVRKVLWLCAEIDLPYALEPWGDGARSTQCPEFLALNPNATVPLIVDEDFALWGAHAILRYLAVRHLRDDLLPLRARERACVEQWLDWQAGALDAAWRAVPAAQLAAPRRSVAVQGRVAVDEWNRQMAILEMQLSKTAFVAGDTFSLADIAIGVAVERWFAAPIEHPIFPALGAYFGGLRMRPNFVRGASG